jgi:hypothetical protein
MNTQATQVAPEGAPPAATSAPKPRAPRAPYVNAGARERNRALPKEVKGQRGNLYARK